MPKSRYRITGSRINGYKQYPETIVEAIRRDSDNKPLEEILQEFATQRAEASSPTFRLSSMPTSSMKKQSALNMTGLTRSVIEKISSGKITTLRNNNVNYTITQYPSSPTSGKIEFSNLHSVNGIVAGYQYTITLNTESVAVAVEYVNVAPARLLSDSDFTSVDTDLHVIEVTSAAALLISAAKMMSRTVYFSSSEIGYGSYIATELHSGSTLARFYDGTNWWTVVEESN